MFNRFASISLCAPLPLVLSLSISDLYVLPSRTYSFNIDQIPLTLSSNPMSLPQQGAKYWPIMQMCLSGAEQRSKIISLDLPATLCPTQPRRLVAILTRRTHHLKHMIRFHCLGKSLCYNNPFSNPKQFLRTQTFKKLIQAVTSSIRLFIQ